MNLHTQSALFLAVFAVVLAVVALDRRRRSEEAWPFAALCLSTAVWAAGYATYKFTGTGYWIAHVGALFVPPCAIWMTRAMLDGRGPVSRVTVLAAFAVSGGLLIGLAIPGFMPGGSGLHRRLMSDLLWQLGGAAYLFVPLLACLFVLFVSKAKVGAGAERRRLNVLFYASFILVMAAILEYAARWGVRFPPVTKALAVIFLYVLYQTGARRKSAGVREIAARGVVVIVSALFLALIYGVIVYWVGNDPLLFVFNTLAASFVILLLYEPVLSRIETRAADLLFKERAVWQKAVREAAAKMTHHVRRDDLRGFVEEELPGILPVAAARLWISGMDLPGVLHESDQGAWAGSASLERSRLDDAGAAAELGAAMDEEGISRVWVLRAQGRVRGLLGLAPIDGEFTSLQLDLLGNFATQMAVQIENASIYERLLQRERLAALGEMAAGLAHEVKNPLGALKGAAQVIDRTRVSEQDRGFLDIIVEESDRLNGTLTRFLEYARPYQPNRERFPVNDLVRRTAGQFRLGDKDAVDLALELPECAGDAWIDGELIKQVLINLLQNAAQAAGEGGRVRVTTIPTSDAVDVVVEDDGPGIDPEAMDKIFDPFFTTKKEGTGLGLAISRRIVEAHAGSIEVGRGKWGGTRFAVRLPRGEEV